ncbi:hypothetical protein ACFWJT_31915 [Streptomyces sp. NPDC127069]|uniref:hypothetical protein n=1 Tax=Streptomyces sp. NPDC127069 TaxID=3347128 RepID=UPI00366116F7
MGALGESGAFLHAGQELEFGAVEGGEAGDASVGGVGAGLEVAEVVQVQEGGVGAAVGGEVAVPGSGEVVGVGGRDGAVERVGAVAAVLVGGVERPAGGLGVLPALERGAGVVVVVGVEVEALVEGGGVGGVARGAEGSGVQAGGDAAGVELFQVVADDLGAAPAGPKLDGGL